MVYARLAEVVTCCSAGKPEGMRMEATKQISPRVAAQVAQRLRLAAGLCSRSMSAIVNEVLDEKLPSMEEIRRQLDGESSERGASDAEAR
jgi:hypothetical protein